MSSSIDSQTHYANSSSPTVRSLVDGQNGNRRERFAFSPVLGASHGSGKRSPCKTLRTENFAAFEDRVPERIR